MSHQESFIYQQKSDVQKNHENLEKVIRLFKKHNVKTIHDPMGRCVARITLKKPFLNYKKGMEFLMVSGDSHSLHSKSALFNYKSMEELEASGLFTKDEIYLIKRLQMTFSDEDKILGELNLRKYSDVATFEYLYLDDEPENMKEMREFAKMIRPNSIVNETDDGIHAVDNFNRLNRQIQEACVKLNLPLKINEETYPDGKVYAYFINEHCIAYYNEPFFKMGTKRFKWTLFYTSDDSLKYLGRELLKLKQTS